MKQSKFYWKLNGTVLIADPPNCIKVNWTTNVEMMMPKNNGLLKKFLKTLTSCCWSFLALIILKSCIRTKILKKRA
jgi:hypothetical protein